MNTLQQKVVNINLPKGVKHYQKPDCDIVTWANKDLPMDVNFIVIALFALSAPLIIFTWLFSHFSELLALVILILIWLVAIFLTIVVFQPLFWTETIVISDRYIVLSRKGFRARKEMCFRKENIIRISYEKYDPWNGGELRYSLNIVYRYKLLGVFTGIESEEFAKFSRKKEKYQFFLYLQAVLQKRDWPTLDGTRS